MFVLLFASCKKDGTQTVAGNGTAPVLSATQSTLVLTAANAAQVATVFNWTASSFGYSAGISYTLQVDTVGDNFKAPKEIAVGPALTQSYTVADLNTLLIQMGVQPGKSTNIQVRTKASIADKYAPAYSNVLSIAVTPYLVAIVYPSLYVPGSYQGWTPATASKITSLASDQKYEGYVNFPDVSTDFKFTSDPDFTHTNYGNGATPGTLNPTGPDNLNVTGAGYYLLKADTKALTYSATKTVWAVIGDATGSWDNETAMTYDPVNKVWTVTKVLVAGALKFRANGNYDINFGANKLGDGGLAYGGDNIPVAVGGNYKITLNLSNPAGYRYSLTKQ